MSRIQFFCLVCLVLVQTACGSDRQVAASRYQAEQDAALDAESEKRAEALSEKNRVAELERQRREEEWERTRVQREAQQREDILREAQRRAEQDRLDRERREQEERQAIEERKRREARLKVLCPLYWAARQTCASASNYESCMNIRSGNRYSRLDDRDCQAR